VTTQKQSPAFLTLITLISDGKYDPLYLRNYANIRVKTRSRAYSRRRPDTDVRRRRLCDARMARSGQDRFARYDRGRRGARHPEQNIQVSAGQLGAEPIKGGSDFLIAINAQGRLRTAEEFGDIVLKTGSTARSCGFPMSRASS